MVFYLAFSYLPMTYFLLKATKISLLVVIAVSLTSCVNIKYRKFHTYYEPHSDSGWLRPPIKMRDTIRNTITIPNGKFVIYVNYNWGKLGADYIGLEIAVPEGEALFLEAPFLLVKKNSDENFSEKLIVAFKEIGSETLVEKMLGGNTYFAKVSFSETPDLFTVQLPKFISLSDDRIMFDDVTFTKTETSEKRIFKIRP